MGYLSNKHLLPGPELIPFSSFGPKISLALSCGPHAADSKTLLLTSIIPTLAPGHPLTVILSVTYAQARGEESQLRLTHSRQPSRPRTGTSASLRAGALGATMCEYWEPNCSWETLLPAPVSNTKSGRWLGLTSQPSKPRGSEVFGTTELERHTVSDWASALSWGQDESELVTELQAGSETAFDWVVTHYHAPVYSLILGMLGDTADAADASQEVFLKAFKGIGSFRQGSSLKTWLYRIAIREALNHRRWFKRHLQKNVSIDAEPEEGSAAIEIEDLSATPFEQLAAHEIQLAVQGALQQVAEVFRSAVILRDLEGLSYEEVAEVLDCSVGTVKSRILRGRRALKEILEPLLGEKELAARRELIRREVVAPAPSLGMQMGLQVAYVRATPGVSEAEVESRHRMTREELP